MNLLWWCEPTPQGNARIRVKNLDTGLELSHYIHWFTVYQIAHEPDILEPIIREMERTIEGKG